MKLFPPTILALLMSLSAVACAATDLDILEPLEPRAEVPTVTLNRGAHPIKLPLDTLAGATFVGSDGELILYDEQKGLYATVVTPKDWGSPGIQMNKAPGHIFRRDFRTIQDPEFRKELEGIARLTLEPADEKALSMVTIGKVTVYIAFSPRRTVIMLTSTDKPNLFTQLDLDNFSWKEIEDEILKGIGGR